MRVPNSSRVAVVYGLLVTGGAFISLQARGEPPQSAATPSSAEKAFLRQVLDINRAELTLANLALERGSSADVKQMATKMVQKHTDLQTQLGELARARGVSVPQAASATREASIGALQKLAGSQFDAMFKQIVADTHKEELALNRNELASGSDPDLRAYAQSRVAALEHGSAKPAQEQPKPDQKQDKPDRDW